MKNRIISYVMLFTVLCMFVSTLAGCSTAEKIPIPTVQKDVYIYDQDNIIDDNVEKSLNRMLVELEEKTEVEFAVVSIQSLLNRSIETYANNLFNTLGIGKKGKDNGVLLLFSRTDTRVRLEIGRGLEGFLNDAKCGRILDDYFVPYRESDEYTKATELTVKAVLNVVAKEYNIEISGLESFLEESTEKSNNDKHVDPVIVIVVILLFIILIAFALEYFGSDGGSSSGGFFSGSSGGSSSGGGFSGGGFGGGFSGGGGASR